MFLGVMFWVVDVLQHEGCEVWDHFLSLFFVLFLFHGCIRAAGLCVCSTKGGAEQHTHAEQRGKYAMLHSHEIWQSGTFTQGYVEV